MLLKLFTETFKGCKLIVKNSKNENFFLVLCCYFKNCLYLCSVFDTQ